MSKQCEIYVKHELGQIDDGQYQEHVKSCEFCQSNLAEDEKILELAGNLKQPVDTVDVWDKIETALTKEKSKNIIQNIFTQRNMILRIAAVLVIGLAIGYYYVQQSQIPDKGIITTSMLEKLEERERDYLESIEELENAAQEKMAQMDLNLMLLYRDKLETIDAQITDCKEALADNPANAHIRRYLFAALKEKKDTLKDIFKLKVNQLEKES